MDYYFNDITFLIPIRLDSIIRLENTLVVVKRLLSLKSHILIYEGGKYDNDLLRRLLPKTNRITYRFIVDDDPVFHKTRYLNMMTDETTTPYLCMWDADVVVEPKQMAQSLRAIKEEGYDISFPFDGDFLETGAVLREMFLKNNSVRFLMKYRQYMGIYNLNHTGGAVFYDRKRYIAAGKHNEKFYGWGPEDLDRWLCWTNLGYKIHRDDGPMFHLTHPRDSNGVIRSTLHKKVCEYNIKETTYTYNK